MARVGEGEHVTLVPANLPFTNNSPPSDENIYYKFGTSWKLTSDEDSVMYSPPGVS